MATATFPTANWTRPWPSGAYTGPAAAALVLLRTHNPRLAKLVKDRAQGVSQADLKSFLDHGIPGQAQSTAGINRGFERLSLRAQAMPPALPLEQENFDAREMIQGRTSSCVMLSTGIGIGNLKSMFEDNHNGTVTVSFADGDRETVKDLTDAERLYHTRAGEGGRWPVGDGHGQRIRSQLVIDGTIRTGADFLYPVPTHEGHDRRQGPLPRPRQTDSQFHPEIAGAQPGSHHRGQSRRLGENDSHFSLESLQNGIVNNHAYTVLKYDSESDVVTLSIPAFGGIQYHPDGNDDGIFEMPLLDFYCSFSWLTAGA